MQRRSIWLGVLILAVSSLQGCFDKEEPTCAYWVPKILQPAFTEKAIDKTTELQCSDALPAMEQLFEDGQLRSKLLRSAKEIGDSKAAAGLLRKALLVGDTGKLAASIVKDWRLVAARPELESILTGRNLPKHREAALDALLSFTKPPVIEDLLIALASEEPDLHGIGVNKRAVEALGEMRSAKAVPTLIRAAFIKDQRGGSIYLAARLAIAKVGPAAIEPLLGLANATDKEFEQWALDRGVQKWEWRKGPELTQLLVDTLDPRAARATAKLVGEVLAQPLGVSPKKKDKWRTDQKNRLTVSMTGLGAMGTDDTVESLMGVVKDKQADAVNQRLRSASALALIGTDKARMALMAFFADKETSEDLKQPLLQPLTQALQAGDLAAFDKLVKKPKARVAAGLKDPKVAAYIGCVRECKSNATCYIEKLKGKDRNQAIKAASVLGSGLGDAATVRKALLQAFAEAPMNDADLRRFPLIALLRRPDAQLGDELIKVAEGLGKREGYWKTELTAYGHWLNHATK